MPERYTRGVLLLLLIGAPVFITLLAIVVANAVDRVRELRRHARVLVDLGVPLTPAAAFGVPKHEVVTIEGTLRGERVVSFHPYGTSFLEEVNVYGITHSAGAGFAIDLDDGAGRVVLDGAVQVLCGATETEHTAPLEAGAIVLGASTLARAKVKKRVGQFRVVTPGDRVRVRGGVEPAPDDDALYRARSNVLRMTPGPSELGMPMITIASTTSRRRRIQSRRGVFVALGVSAVLGGGVAAGTTAVGARMQPSTSAISVANDASVVVVARPAPACRAEMAAKLSKYDIGVMAAACDDEYARAMAYFAAGDFAASSKEYAAAVAKDPNTVPSLAEVEAHLFAYAFDEAASVVRRMITQFYPGPDTEEKRHLTCILDVLTQRGADALRTKTPRFRKVCSPTRPFLKLARELDSEGSYRGEDDWPRPTYRQDTKYDAVGETFTSVIEPRARLTARPVAIERDLLDRLLLQGNAKDKPFGNLEGQRVLEYDEAYVLLTTFAAEVTLFYAYAGFPERSAPYWPILDRVADMLSKEQSFHQGDNKKRIEEERTLLTFVMAIAGAAALYSDDAVRMKRYTGHAEPYSSQAARQWSKIVAGGAWEDPVVDRAWPEHKAVFDAAQSGNAAEVARLLTEQHSTGRSTLPRALPQLGKAADRSPLDRWFHSDGYPAACLTCGASTFLGDLSDRREIARLLNDTQTRDQLRQAAERFTAALTDGTIGFELDELETFFSKKKK